MIRLPLAFKILVMVCLKKSLIKFLILFYPVDKLRSREMGGSGLGVSIVKRIVEKHNGELLVNSIPNIGTLFILKFIKI